MSDMELIVGDRGSGRTTDLIRWAAAEQRYGPMRYIICHSHREAYRLRSEADRMELPIAFPLSWREAAEMRGATRQAEVVIDNLSLILPTLLPVRIQKVVW